MIKFKELTPFLDKWTYFPNGEEMPELSLEFCKLAIEESATNLALPVEVFVDQINVGGLFKKEEEACLVVRHPEHIKDYISLVFRLRTQGNMQIIQVDQLGTSKQLKKLHVDEFNRKHREERWHNSDHTISQKMLYSVGNKLGNAIATFGLNKAKVEQEKEYYQILSTILSQFSND
ncbi:TPA: hypothetical protein U2D03_001607 [Streptococcus suis]|nr:hypothetical protein [Streptococcus suis]